MGEALRCSRLPLVLQVWLPSQPRGVENKQGKNIDAPHTVWRGCARPRASGAGEPRKNELNDAAEGGNALQRGKRGGALVYSSEGRERQVGGMGRGGGATEEGAGDREEAIVVALLAFMCWAQKLSCWCEPASSSLPSHHCHLIRPGRSEGRHSPQGPPAPLPGPASDRESWLDQSRSPTARPSPCGRGDGGGVGGGGVGRH